MHAWFFILSEDIDLINLQNIGMESIRHSAHIRNENVGHPLESNSNDVDNPVLDQTENARQKRARGPTYMTRVWARKGRKEVQFNEYGQAIDLNKSEYVQFVGTLVRGSKLLPIDIKDWHRVPKPTKSKLVELVKIDPELSRNVLVSKKLDTKIPQFAFFHFRSFVQSWIRARICQI